MSSKPISLQEIREKINAIDSDILRLLEARGEVALQVADVKRQQKNDPVIYRPEREAQMIRRYQEQFQGALDSKDVGSIFRAIISSCRSLQQQQTIAYLGPEGTYSQQAVIEQFGPSVKLIPVVSIEEVFNTIKRGDARYGVVPIENSTTGMINPTLDNMIQSPLKICGEVNVKVECHLLVRDPENAPVEVIYGHPQILAQCNQWLAKHYPTAKKVSVNSNGMAAKMANDDSKVAAIAGPLAEDHYELARLASHIEDNPNNTTRFVVLGNNEIEPSGDDKTSLLITTPHKPGSLLELIKPFASNDVNLTSISSRPYEHQMWSYIFFIDIDGHYKDEKVQKALDALGKEPIMYNILGSYPKAVNS